MAFVDLKRNLLVLKVIVAGPPAVGKTERLKQIGRFARYGTSIIGEANVARLLMARPGASRPTEIEFYEWHGPEKADLRAKALFTGLDGLVYLADAREDRYADTRAHFDFLVKRVGRTRITRLPGLLVLGHLDEGLLRLASFDRDLKVGPTWTEKLEIDRTDADRWVEGARLLGEAMLARII